MIWDAIESIMTSLYWNFCIFDFRNTGRALCGLDSMISDTKLTLLNHWIVVSKQSIKRCTGNRCLYGMWLITVPYTPISSADTHYHDVIMGEIASQITSLAIVYSAVYSGVDQRKHHSSASLAFVRGIHRWPVNSPHKGPVTRKMFPLDDVIMN